VDFGSHGLNSEILILKNLHSNPYGKNVQGQCLVGSFGGALSS
jgi:hypothetical protein